MTVKVYYCGFHYVQSKVEIKNDLDNFSYVKFLFFGQTAITLKIKPLMSLFDPNKLF